ncbi:MAG: phosphoesterase [Burkholderiales bacterium]|nr:phosphoesterase [Burkholderiales bacterium]
MSNSIARVRQHPMTKAVLAAAALCAAVVSLAAKNDDGPVVRAALPPGAIDHVLVINLENESYASTFGPSSPAVYLNQTLLAQGELLVNYYGTSHVSLGNYIAQVSGQSPTPSTNNDCLNLASLKNPPLLGGFTDVAPGTDTSDPTAYPGQVVGDGCVYPAPGAGTHGAMTIGDQLDARDSDRDHGPGDRSRRLNWREYAEDMGNNPSRDYGTPDAMGGADCAHPPVGGNDNSNSAAADDQYATRHNPFVYFHSVIDDQARCNAHVVPLGGVAVGRNGAADVFQGHLYEDLRRIETTPRYAFVTPNLCNDGHDAICAGANTEGTTNAAGQHIGGLVGADLWLKHWMPMIFASPAYRSGRMLVVITFDESGFGDARACPSANQADCHSPTGPNVGNPGYSPILGLFGYQKPPTALYQYAGGGQIGAVLFNPRHIVPGTVNTIGVYNHYSALRSYEDLLGITAGGDDGHGHLGYAATPGMLPYGRDVFNARPTDDAP